MAASQSNNLWGYLREPSLVALDMVYDHRDHREPRAACVVCAVFAEYKSDDQLVAQVASEHKLWHEAEVALDDHFNRKCACESNDACKQLRTRVQISLVKAATTQITAARALPR